MRICNQFSKLTANSIICRAYQNFFKWLYDTYQVVVWHSWTTDRKEKKYYRVNNAGAATESLEDQDKLMKDINANRRFLGVEAAIEEFG